MSETRPQGRPRRGAAEVGRSKIISRLQAIVRTSRDLDLSRKTLAELAGVTPALISYYFPRKDVLFEEISRPILSEYRREMETIILSTCSNETKLQELVKILLDLHTKDGAALEIYAMVTRKAPGSGDGSPCEINTMTSMLAHFFSKWRGHPDGDWLDASVLQGAIWGMCRYAARIDPQKRCFDEDMTLLVGRVVKSILPTPTVAIAQH